MSANWLTDWLTESHFRCRNKTLRNVKWDEEWLICIPSSSVCKAFHVLIKRQGSPNLCPVTKFKGISFREEEIITKQNLFAFLLILILVHGIWRFDVQKSGNHKQGSVILLLLERRRMFLSKGFFSTAAPEAVEVTVIYGMRKECHTPLKWVIKRVYESPRTFGSFAHNSRPTAPRWQPH